MKYIVNRETKEIHRSRYAVPACGIFGYASLRSPFIRPEYPRVCWLAAMWLIWFRGYDGCGHCWAKQHKK